MCGRRNRRGRYHKIFDLISLISFTTESCRAFQERPIFIVYRQKFNIIFISFFSQKNRYFDILFLSASPSFSYTEYYATLWYGRHKTDCRLSFKQSNSFPFGKGAFAKKRKSYRCARPSYALQRHLKTTVSRTARRLCANMACGRSAHPCARLHRKNAKSGLRRDDHRVTQSARVQRTQSFRQKRQETFTRRRTCTR